MPWPHRPPRRRIEAALRPVAPPCEVIAIADHETLNVGDCIVADDDWKVFRSNDVIGSERTTPSDAGDVWQTCKTRRNVRVVCHGHQGTAGDVADRASNLGERRQVFFPRRGTRHRGECAATVEKLLDARDDANHRLVALARSLTPCEYAMMKQDHTVALRPIDPVRHVPHRLRQREAG